MGFHSLLACAQTAVLDKLSNFAHLFSRSILLYDWFGGGGGGGAMESGIKHMIC